MAESSSNRSGKRSGRSSSNDSRGCGAPTWRPTSRSVGQEGRFVLGEVQGCDGCHGCYGGTSVIVVDLIWSFYDMVNDRFLRDAEGLFMSAPGYAVIPEAKDRSLSRVRYMAEHYLTGASA